MISLKTAKLPDELVAIIRRHLPDVKLYLFGSRARSNYQQGADIDIALDGGGPLNRMVMAKINADIEESTIPIVVDVVDFYRVSDSMREEIIREGILWTS